MKKIKNLSLFVGFMMLLMMAGLEASVEFVAVWFSVSVVMIYFGGGFSFQHKMRDTKKGDL